MPLPCLVNTLGMRFRRVPAGLTRIGSPLDEHKRSVTDLDRRSEMIARPFWMAETPTTGREYLAVTGECPSHFTEDFGGHSGDTCLSSECPVESVSWNKANEFCERLSRVPAERQAGRRYRLPSEVEWEHACRAGAETAFSIGTDLPSDCANFDGTFPYIDGPPGTYLQRTSPVRSYCPNAFHLFDVHGNVWEWCADLFCPDALTSAAAAPRVLRGGGWHSYARTCRCSARDAGEPDIGYFDQGFRIVCVLEAD